MIKGIILDFNGTLYRDHDLNDRAWEETFYRVAGTNNKDKYEDFDVSTEVLTKDYDYSKTILQKFNKDCSDESILQLSKYKEDLYIKYAKEEKRKELLEGVPDFLEYLKNNDIPYCIASMAPIWNFNFYFEYLDLGKWFTFDNIVSITESTNIKALGLSVLLSLISTLICLILAYPLAMILAESGLNQSSFMVFIFILTM